VYDFGALAGVVDFLLSFDICIIVADRRGTGRNEALCHQFSVPLLFAHCSAEKSAVAAETSEVASRFCNFPPMRSTRVIVSMNGVVRSWPSAKYLSWRVL
jgi:hypothetical protein